MSSETDFLATDRLLQLAREKRECLAVLHKLGTCQMRLIADGRLTELLELLGAKQRVMGQLQDLEGQLAPFRDQRPHERRWRSEPLRRECADLLADCERLLAETVDQERRSESELRLRRDDAAQKLGAAHWAGQARGAYVRPHDVPRQIDLSSQG